MLRMLKVMALHVELGENKVVGTVAGGRLTIIPIVGGSFEGEGIRGRICPGGADWNTQISDRQAHICARYWLETDDGAIISITNEGWIDSSDQDAKYKTTPRFECDLHGRYAHLTRGAYVGELEVGVGNSVDIVFWKLQ